MPTRDFTLKVDGLDIVARLYPPEGKAPYTTVCVCHGIPAGIPDPSDKGYALLAEQVCRHGFGVLLFNFRGTGASGGNLDILGWTRDLKAVIDYLCALPEVDRLALLGFSAGAAVAIYVAAAEGRVSSVATCACPAEFTFLEPSSLIDHFRSIGAIRDSDFPPSLQDWLNGFKLVKPIKYVAKISPRPLLLVHGSRDETVAVSDAHRLYERAGEPKKLVIIDGAGHRLRRDERVVPIVIDWLKSYTPPRF
jgi:fermentation-respiration switch protein FrsA (DUF1100 family)